MGRVTRESDHEFGQFLGRGLGIRAFGHLPASPQDCDPVGGGHDFVQLVTDENDRKALSGHALQGVEQAQRLGSGKNGGGLVQDQDSRVAVERLEDFDTLAFSDRQTGHAGIGVDRQAKSIRQCKQPGATLRATAPDAQQRFRSQHDVVQDAQVAREREVLVHHADASPYGSAGATRRQRLPKDLHRALVGSVVAKKDVHQRCLARTVFAQKRENLALFQLERHVVICGHAAEASLLFV